MGAKKEAYEGVSMDNRVVGFLESHHMRKKNRSIYTALEEENYHWSVKDVREFDEMYEAAMTLNEIAEYFERTPLEILILALDRIHRGKIDMREGWKIW